MKNKFELFALLFMITGAFTLISVDIFLLMWGLSLIIR